MNLAEQKAARIAQAKSGTPQHAYTLLEIKAIDDDERVIEGIATTPTPDAMDDIIEPMGAEFKLPLPFLKQHDSREPIGQVISAKVGPKGITVRVKLIKVTEPPALKERLDVAWAEIKSGLVRGLSIGFSPLEWSDIKGTYGLRYIRWAWRELSAVTIPANMEASITAIKSADEAARRAAHGAPGKRPFVRSAGKPSLPDASGKQHPFKTYLFPE
jgi:HK97 family phage prohead protease